MDRDDRRRFEEYRRDVAGPIENTLFDELGDGDLDRAEFLQRATMFGLSATVIGSALRFFGDAPLAYGARETVKVGGRLKVGIIPPPTKGLDPHTYADQGGLEVGGIAGEFLTRATQGLKLLPELAVSWRPNRNATVWTYRLRPNVRFQNGKAFDADDVV